MRKLYTKTALLGLLIAIYTSVTFSVSATENEVYIGGMPFGVRFGAGVVTVVKTNYFISGGNKVCPADEVGICPEDVIKSIDGVSVESVYEVMNLIKSSDKDKFNFKIERNGKDIDLEVAAQKCDQTGTKQIGVMLKDSAAGIGTVTYIKTDALTFAGLGHGICDNSDGHLLKINNGYISDVKITDINKGKAGAPGELIGTISSEKCGKLLSNLEVGVYGVFTRTPSGADKKIEIADKKEIKAGKAHLLCTLDDNIKKEYEIEISKIQHFTDSKTKNFTVKVTDKELLEKTGGIVQGMSGSPIIQNGKLIGAVTHVLVNDPTTGYGIFIENMLDFAS